MCTIIVFSEKNTKNLSSLLSMISPCYLSRAYQSSSTITLKVERIDKREGGDSILYFEDGRQLEDHFL